MKAKIEDEGFNLFLTTNYSRLCVRILDLHQVLIPYFEQKCVIINEFLEAGETNTKFTQFTVIYIFLALFNYCNSSAMFLASFPKTFSHFGEFDEHTNLFLPLEVVPR